MMKVFSPPFSSHVFQATYGAQPRLATSHPSVAILGDSITAFNTTVNATDQSYNTIGYMTWLNILSGQQFYFPVTNNFGYPGDTLAQILARVPSVIAAKPTICIVLGGTNNAKNNGLTSLATMKTDMIRIIAPLMAVGICVVVMTIPPDSRLSADEQLVRQAYNRWLVELGTGRPDLMTAASLPAGQVPVVVDINPYLTDQTTGGWISGLSGDGIHPLVPAAYYMGRALWSALRNIAPSNNYSPWQDYSDVYSATQNPTGCLLSGHSGTLAGTTGTLIPAGTTSMTGQLATGWTLANGNPVTSTTSITCSKQNPRTDGPLSGERQEFVFATTGAGSSADNYQFLQLGIGIGNMSAGDRIVAQATYELVACQNLSSIRLLCQKAGAAPRGGYDGYANLQGNIPDNAAHTGVLRTPAITLPAGDSELRFYLWPFFNTTSGSAGATMYLSDARIFKL